MAGVGVGVVFGGAAPPADAHGVVEVHALAFAHFMHRVDVFVAADFASSGAAAVEAVAAE